MRPEFGCAVHDHIFDVLDASAFGAIESAVREAIERWEPRASVVAVDFDLSGRHEGRLDIVLTYEIPEVPGVRNLVHPFYVIPEEEGLETRSSTRRSSRGEAAGDQPRRPRLPGARVGGAHAHRAPLPGVDRAQRLGPRHHADRAVRVDDRDDDVPAQPGPGQDLRPPARAARRADEPGDAGPHARALHARRRRPRSRSRSRPARPRSGPCARPTRSRSSSRSPRAARSSRSRRPPTSSTATASGATSPSTPASRGPIGADRAAFSAVPVPSDAMHLGFDEPLSRLLMRITVEAEPARGAGVDPRRPPLRWEMSAGEQPGGDLAWEPVTVLEDTTGGFNFGSRRRPARVRRRQRARPVRRPSPALAALPRRDARGGRRRGLRAPARGLHDHRRARRRDPHLPARRARRQRGPRRERRHAGPVVHRPAPADPRALRRRVARGARPADRRLGALGAAGRLQRVRPRRPRLRLRPGARHDRARPRGPPGRRRLALLRRGAAEGRDAAHVALSHRRRPARQRPAGHADGPEGRAAGDRLGDEPVGRARRRRPRGPRHRARCAARWSCARATGP